MQSHNLQGNKGVVWGVFVLFNYLIINLFRTFTKSSVPFTKSSVPFTKSSVPFTKSSVPFFGVFHDKQG